MEGVKSRDEIQKIILKRSATRDKCGLPLTAPQVIAIRKVEQITSQEKVNMGDRTKIISVILHIKYQKMLANKITCPRINQ